MRVCVIYDCLYPYTVGGAERWYRNLAQRLAEEGHEVTYLTLRQWDRGEQGTIPGVRVVTAGPRMALYVDARRRILPPLVFGAGVLWHLLRHGRRYDVVHTASFPYFSLLAAALARTLGRFAIVVDWHEVWSAHYWRDYLGAGRGRIGHAVQRLCARVPQTAFTFSRLYAARLREEGLPNEATVLEGEYEGDLGPPRVLPAKPVVMFAGRLIPEKRAPAAVHAMRAAADRIPGLRGEVFGQGPQDAEVRAAIDGDDRVAALGFVVGDQFDAHMRRALCVLAPSSREGYGLVVVEASARGVPAIVVAGEDNAAVELIEDGVNGYVAQSADPEVLADAVERVHAAGGALRQSTADWFTLNAVRLSLASSLERVVEAYRDGDSPAGPSTRR
ncbi:MAG TPA: glycosyltransferase family 4 protein [Solirubrobacteraceae bacterium]|nr:glycosyltransferase family 4 protein [Solirubrobacteraceae bacterium]